MSMDEIVRVTTFKQVEYFGLFAAICALDMDVGPCRGRFVRWFYDVSTHKCMEFTYGGCRGNNNRFRSFEECHEMCVEHMRSCEIHCFLIFKQFFSKSGEKKNIPSIC